MKRLIPLLTLAILLALPLTARAVTEREMDQARAIAARNYLRYANDGSGYLDQVKPTSLADLEKKLKPTEKRNIVAFKSIAVPKDYPSWNKAKLVEYWSQTAFASKGLIEKGRLGRKRTRTQIEKMTVSGPAPKEAPSQANTAEKPAPQTVPAPAPEPVAEATQTPAPEATAQADSIKAAAEAEAQMLATMQQDEPEDEPIEKADNHTWIYVIVLCILVGVVVALVVFASNIMKREGRRKPEDQDRALAAQEAANASREQFAEKLALKNSEIKTLNRKLENLNNENNLLKGKLEALTAEVTTLRARLHDNATADYAPAPMARQQAPAAAPQPAVAAATATATAEAPAQPRTRTYYVGRANQRGYFECADRIIKPGSSVFRLESTDGFVGTFRVIEEPAVWQHLLRTPAESLGGACAAVEPSQALGKFRIVTDASGTAVNEGGYWRVIRKAKIHFE